MPANLKCTAFFRSDAGKGWSESHYREIPTPAGSLLPYVTAFAQLQEQFRVPLLSADCCLQAVRVSYETLTGAIASSPIKYAPVKRPANKQAGSSPSIAAMCRMGTASNEQWSSIYLRGFWDSVEEDEELNFDSASGKTWRGLLTAYIAGLTGTPYGWLAQNAALSRRGEVTGYTVGVDGFVTFEVQVVEGDPLPIAGTPPFQIRVSGLNNSKSVLNTTHIVKPVDATHVKTVLRTAALPFTEAGKFVWSVTGLATYSGMQYCILARRAMGRPTNSSPARLPARARG